MSESNQFKLGYDYLLYNQLGIRVPIYAYTDSHIIVVGGSGSGKSTAILYWLYNMMLQEPFLDISVADYKQSNELIGFSRHFAQSNDCVELIREYYQCFLDTPEGGRGIQLLVIDEIAGLLTHLSVYKETKHVADEIRSILSEVLMLGRSRRCFILLSMQRYTSTIFPASSGAGDNFMVSVGLGRLTVDGRRGLFGGEHFDGEDNLLFSTGRGIALIDGNPLQGIILPRLSKAKLLNELTNNA